MSLLRLTADDSDDSGYDLEVDELDVSHPDYLYGVDKILKIRSHQPPQPFGDRDLKPPFDKNPGALTKETLMAHSPCDSVFIHTPREKQQDRLVPEGLSKYIAQEDSATLAVTKRLSTGDGIGAQVVVCKFKRQWINLHRPTMYWDKMGHSDDPVEVVAKIYDPLLYEKHGFLFDPKVRLNVVGSADRAYAIEAAAYAELHEAAKTQPILRDFVPRFYGTWTTMVKNEGWGCSDTRPSDDGANGILQERPVRIILMEYIKGRTIWNNCRVRYKDGNPVLFPDESKGHDLNFRLNILARILRGLMAMEHVGVGTPRYMTSSNFVIADAEDQDTDERLQPLGKHRVVMVSYVRSEIDRYIANEFRDDPYFPRPRHPACSNLVDPYLVSRMNGWLPREWYEDRYPYKQFLEWAQKAFRPEDFTCEDEIETIFERLNAESVASKPRKIPRRVPIPPPAPFEPFKETKAPRESAKQLSKSEKDAPSTQNIREAILGDQEEPSAANADPIFDNDSGNGLGKQKE